LTQPEAVSHVRVRYAETDQMGVVYYANYFVWFEVGRTDLLRLDGWSYKDMEHEGFSLPVVAAYGEYRAPARYDDVLGVKTRGRLLSPVRVRFDYEVVREVDAAVLATGYTEHAVLDRSGRPRRLPERARQMFTSVHDISRGDGNARPASRSDR
jgi:acyl-CoA thioester hydrolase